MSSACVCHLKEWCFYCEVFRPMEDRAIAAEKERDELRNALEAIRDFKLGNALVHVQTLKEMARLALGGESHETP